jgi:hypothetical protein
MHETLSIKVPTVAHFGANLPTLFAIVAAGSVLSGVFTAIAVGVQLGMRVPISARGSGPETDPIPTAETDRSRR